MDKLHTVKEAADILNVHPNSIYKRVKTGDIPAYKIPGIGIRLKFEELMAWVVSHTKRKEILRGGAR